MKTYELFILCLIITFAFSQGTSDDNEDNEFEGNNTGIDYPAPVTNQQPSLVFLLFSDFKTTPVGEKVNIFVKIWLKRIRGSRNYNKLKMRMTINRGKKLRSLEEVEETAECIPPSKEDIENNKMDIVPYDCSVTSNSNEPVSSLVCNPDTIEIEGGEGEVIVGPLAKEQMNHLEDQTKSVTLDKLANGEMHFGTLFNSTLERDGKDFKLKGFLDDIDFPPGTLYLILPKKNNEDEPTNTTCKFEPNKAEQKGTLICENPKALVETTLEGKVATDKDGDKLLTIGMLDSNQKLDNSNGGGINNYSRQKSSDGGLSGGAIAGIVIACAVALVAAAITAVVCRAPAKPPLQEESTLGVNTNNVIIN